MDKDKILKDTAEHVKQKMQGEGSHDWFHVYRVWKNVQHIAAQEKADRFVVEMAALLHDLDDFKLTGEHSDEKKNASAWMKQCGIDGATQEKVIDIIRNMSFTDHLTGRKKLSKEGEIVQDADRLDAIGAIGIARCFAYGGSKKRALYNPDRKPEDKLTTDKYIDGDSPSVNHFYEKLLLLKDLMNTSAGKQIAEGRHRYMENYLKQFYAEWEGKD